MEKQSCLKCKNFFNLKLFMKSDNRPEELLHNLIDIAMRGGK